MTNPKKKSCRICGEKYQPIRSIQPTCLKFECQVAYAQQAAEKSAKRRERESAAKSRADIAARKEKLKGYSDYVKEVDEAFQAYVRYRDKDKTCICCGVSLMADGNTGNGGYFDAGHYIPRKHKATRWDESNCHGQRKYCNQHLGGNYVGYRIGLIARISEAEVLRLEAARNETRKHTIPELIELRDKYLTKLKALKLGERFAA